MNQPCLFHIENFDCGETDVQDCLHVLDKKIHSRLTPDAHKKKIPLCAERIEKRPESGAGNRARELRAQAGAAPIQISSVQDDTIDLKKSLPGLEPGDWKKFLKEKKNSVHPFQLVLYLNDCWLAEKNRFQNGNTPEKIQLKIVGHVQQIIKAVLKAYPNDKETLFDMIGGIENETESISMQFLEKRYREDFRELENNKNWPELSRQVIGLGNRSRFSEFFNEELIKWEEQAWGGISWLRLKESFLEFVSQWNNESLETLVDNFSARTPDLQVLFSTRIQWGSREECKMLTDRAGDFYLRCIQYLQEQEIPVSRAYEFMKEYREKFQAVFAAPPREWDEYFQTLSGQLGEAFSRDLRHILETMDDFYTVREGIRHLEKKVNEVDLEQNLVEIESVRVKLDSLEELEHSLQDIIDHHDPTYRYPGNHGLKKLTGHFEKSAEHIAQWKIARGLMERAGKVERFLEKAAQVDEQFADLLDLLKFQSRKVLDDEHDVDFSLARERWENIRENTSQLHAEHKRIRFAGNLKCLAEVFGNIVFSTPGAVPHPPGQYIKSDVYLNLKERTERGKEFLERLAVISRSEQREPVLLMGEFFKAVEDHREQDFIFSQPTLDQTLEIIREIKSKIERLIEEELDDAKNELTPMLPLLAGEKLDARLVELEKLIHKMPVKTDDFKGYHALLLPFKARVEELICMASVQQFIHRNNFQEAAHYVEGRQTARRPFKKYLMACIHYYRDLDEKEWDDESWLRFFRINNPGDIDHENQTGGILSKYEKLFSEYFLDIEPDFLSRHLEIILEYLPNSHWIPFLSYLSGKSGADELVGTVCRDAPLKHRFPTVLDYLISHRMWPRYAEIYRASEGRLDDQFEKSPFDVVNESMDDEYEKLKKRFIRDCSIDQKRLDDIRQLIPGDDQFDSLRQKFDEISDIFDCYQDIENHLNRYKKTDIWTDLDFESLLREIEDKYDCFTGDFVEIKKQKKWGVEFKTLQKIYQEGLGLIELFRLEGETISGHDLPLNQLRSYEGKAAREFGTKVGDYLRSIYSRWESFREKIQELPSDYITLLDMFDREHFKGVFRTWCQTRFWTLWQKRNGPVPATWREFFDMIEIVLTNHQSYVSRVDKKEPVDLESLEVLDPYIEKHLSHQRNISR